MINCRVRSGEIGEKTPFSDRLYLISTVLDPHFGFMWLEIDGPTREEDITVVTDQIKGRFRCQIQVAYLCNKD